MMKGCCSSSFLFWVLLLALLCIHEQKIWLCPSVPPHAAAAARSLMEEEDDDLKKKTIRIEEEESFKIGSRPPSCAHKCYGCQPCQAIQVPTTTTRASSLGVQYANYEPEGWKCKCGPSFYSP